jgi:hypothetical protein
MVNAKRYDGSGAQLNHQATEDWADRIGEHGCMVLSKRLSQYLDAHRTSEAEIENLKRSEGYVKISDSVINTLFEKSGVPLSEFMNALNQ